LQARNELFRMIMEGRSFSGRERNCCFLNTGGGRFATISALSGLDFPDDGRCIALTDWDRDGDQDLWISNRNAPRLRFMQNNADVPHHFVALQLVGNGTSTNRDAIGARVEIVLRRSESTASDAIGAPSRLVQTLRAGEGFLSQSSKWMHFGLGTATDIQQIIVRWPGGDAQTLEGFAADQRYRITQGQPLPERITTSGNASAITAGEAPLPRESRVSRVALVTRVSMPKVAYRGADGAAETETFGSHTPTLINLWASWCSPCLQELSDFTSDAQRIRDAGVRVISLNIDQLASQQASATDGAALLQRLNYPHASGTIESGEMSMLQELHDQFFFLKRPLPLPASFLVDAQGRLSVIYRGPVTVEQLLADAHRSDGGDHDAALQAACLPGRTLDHPRVAAVARRDELQTRYRVAAWLEETGRYADALRNFLALAELDPHWALPRRHLAKLHLHQGNLHAALQNGSQALELEPDSAPLHNTLSLISSRRGNEAAAESHARTAIRLDPNFAEAHNNLGTVLATRGQIEAARQCFVRAVEIDDEFAEAHTNLGSAYAAQSNLPKAIQHYERAVAINPRYIDAINNLGSIYARQGRLREAISQYQRVLQIDPQYRDAQRNLELAIKLLNARRN
jgi:tetratricopeptide (TPR) repeat protein